MKCVSRHDVEDNLVHLLQASKPDGGYGSKDDRIVNGRRNVLALALHELRTRSCYSQ